VITFRVTSHSCKADNFSTSLAGSFAAVGQVVAEFVILEVLRMSFHVFVVILSRDSVRVADQATTVSIGRFQHYGLNSKERVTEKKEGRESRVY
jgi:hypothetical protein